MKSLLICVVIVLIVIVLLKSKKCSVEGYRDPIYLNRAKYIYDIYPRANGSIYGFPYRYGGSWNLFSGFPYYDRAY